MKTINQGDSLTKSTFEFAKMQALGNDFVVFSEEELSSLPYGKALLLNWEEEGSRLAKALCNRHFGVGADGLIVVRTSNKQDCDLGWSYINSDGSPSDMCGNGLRALALWAVNRQLIKKDQFSVSTGKGPMGISFVSPDQISVNMGLPILASQLIPVAGPARECVVLEPIEVNGSQLRITCVSMGNPHCVIFEPHLNPFDYDVYAPKIQALPYFPEGVNVEFVVLENDHTARVIVWERGCGPTLACASGAAAVVVAGVLERKLRRKSLVKLPGGQIDVEWSEEDSQVRLTGAAREAYKGTINLSQILAEADKR